MNFSSPFFFFLYVPRILKMKSQKFVVMHLLGFYIPKIYPCHPFRWSDNIWWILSLDWTREQWRGSLLKRAGEIDFSSVCLKNEMNPLSVHQFNDFSLIDQLISFINQLISSFIHTHSFIHSFIQLFNHPFDSLFRSLGWGTQAETTGWWWAQWSNRSGEVGETSRIVISCMWFSFSFRMWFTLLIFHVD